MKKCCYNCPPKEKVSSLRQHLNETETESHPQGRLNQQPRVYLRERSSMNLAESSVRYPISVIVRVLLVIVFGYVCVQFLGVELKPDTEQPVLVVVSTFPGAAPADVEGEITTRFEESISGVSNMLYTQSYSRLGESLILVFYRPGTNLDLAAAELQRNLERVKDLPKEVDRPQIFKASDRVSLPVYQFSSDGDG